MENPDKPLKKKAFCKRCDMELRRQVHRTWFVKNILFFLPLRKYICINCLRTYHIFK